MVATGPMRPRLIGCVALWVVLRCVPALADDRFEVPSPSNYGGAGLLDTRTARFFPDGYLDFTASLTSPDTRYSLTLQALPWAEFTFRYAINQAIAHNPVDHDRSFDVKIRLSHESEYWPELALGLQDFIGTGLYSGEYLVGSKRWGPVDFSLGLGWGRLGSRGTFENPFSLLGKSWLVRNHNTGSGGAFALNSYFHGPDVGLFGGLEYETPIPGLRLKVEYSTDRYAQENTDPAHPPKNYSFPVNAGISYRPFDWLDVGVSWMHGRYLGLRFSAVTDLTALNWPARLDPAPRFRARPGQAADTILQQAEARASSNDSAVETRFVDLTADDPRPQLPALPTLPAIAIPALPAAPPAAQNGPAPDAAERIKAGIEGQKLVLAGIGVEDNKISILIENPRYRRDTEAIARTARVLSAAAPPSIDEFEITLLSAGQPVSTVRLQRREIDAIARRAGSPAELYQTAEILPGQSAPLDHLPAGMFPKWDAFAYPVLQQSLFDPDNPFYFRLGVGAGAETQITRGWFVNGDLLATIYDNFSQIQRESNSVLPHVRSDISHYLKQGKYGIADLTTSYFFKLAPEIYGRATGGILEEMFAGVGGELLYRPYGARWAVGLDIWAVRQRGFDDLLDLRHYQAITGHITGYYDLPWHDVSVAVSAGQYLAGDKGVTFQFFRSFSTGVRIGAWFTLTNVSAARFGEGSFDKGISIYIPLEWVAPFSSRSSYTLALRPIQRDGGQRLLADTILYDMTSGADYGSFIHDWNSIFR